MRLLRWPIHIGVDFEWPAPIQRMLARAIEPVVVTSLRLRHVVDCENGEPECLVAVLEFNGEQANASDPEHVDLNHLKTSLDRDGTFFIWTCSCGDPGCAGLFDGVRVTHSGGRTLWHDLDGNRTFITNSQGLRDAYTCGIIEGRQLLKERPQLEPTPEQNDSAYRDSG